jgi:hypothetical protein
MELIVANEPILTEGDIQIARVLVSPDGSYSIAVQFTTHGQLILEMETTGHRGKRIGVLAEWPEQRWIAAPQIKQTLRDGVFVFTPDCSPEEADRIVKGLNNVAIEVKNQPKPGKPPKEDKDGEEWKRIDSMNK